MRSVVHRLPCTALGGVVSLVAGARSARAQDGHGTGTFAGAVRDSSYVRLSGATVAVLGTSVSAVTGADGTFRLVHVPAGQETVVIRRLGFAADSVGVTIRAGATTAGDITLRPAAVELAGVVVRASPRMAETEAAALAVQEHAINIVSALSGDEIRSLPNFNAAEAAGRIPGVSLERDEGEGKFVQVRGTEPLQSNVTIDGVHVPGTEADRIPKLDDVPSVLLA